MDKGSLSERYLTRSVLKHIQKQKNNETECTWDTVKKSTYIGAAVGNDYAHMDGVISADGCSEDIKLAWIKAMNNLACSGGVCTSARVVMLLPEFVKESQIKVYMDVVNTFAREAGIQILGGHTQLTAGVIVPQFIVTAIGKQAIAFASKKELVEGLDIIMTKDTGLYGTNVMLQRRCDDLTTRFANSYLKESMVDEKLYSIVPEASLLRDNVASSDLFYMHDISTGGIYRSLWQLGTWTSKGFLIDHAKIAIRQETIELCEYFNINPYMIDGTGSLLAIVRDGEAVVAMLAKHGIEASVLGKITEEKEKIIDCPGGSRRCMVPASEDELYRI